MKETKIKVFLMGGAGNQFFQISRAHSLVSSGFTVELVDLGRFKKNVYKLMNLTLHDDWISSELVAKRVGVPVRKIRLLELFHIALHYVLKKLGIILFFDRSLEDLIKFKEKAYLSIFDVGYFQSGKKNKLTSMHFVARSILAEIGAKNIQHDNLLVHVRGGDFISSERLAKNNVLKFLNLSKELCVRLEVVTNDKNFTEDLFSDFQSPHLFDGKNAHDDFCYMCQASFLYVSNSTFGLWAALCAQINSNTKIYAASDFPHKDFLEPEML